MTPKQTTWTCPKCASVTLQVNRHRDADGRLSKHCGCRVSKTKGMTPEQLAEHKRQVTIDLKRKYRREAGCMLRSDIAARAVKRREAIEITKALKPKLHDAHVKRFKAGVQSRKSSAARYYKNPENGRARASKRRESLNDSYVIQNIKVMGIPVDSITPALIAIKREAMQYARMSRVIKTTIKTHWKEENETITKHP